MTKAELLRSIKDVPDDATILIVTPDSWPLKPTGVEVHADGDEVWLVRYQE